MLIYADKVTNRVRYAFHLLLKDVLHLKESLTFTDDISEFESCDGPAINYSNKLKGKVQIMPSRLLFEHGIAEQEIAVSEWEGLPIFFATSIRSKIPFDLFAAGFYMATRYEEYLPHRSDSHQRFSAQDSLAWQNGFLKRPVVDLWGLKLKETLSEAFPDLKFGERKYRYLNTIDVDNAWAFRQKGFMRTLAGFGSSLFRFDFSTFSERLKVLLGKARDPYDTYEFLLKMQREHNAETIYFFLLADYGLNDKNVPVFSDKFQSLIKSLADYAQVGIHPSYGSNHNPERLRTEVARLAEITRQEVKRSRQHFLKLAFPDTYRRLVSLDITEDHTMGFASQVGFRSGLCSSYQHYDLDQEAPSVLRIQPFAVMDGTLNEYLKISPAEAIAVVKELIAEVRAVDGTFVSLWHNETVNDRGKWKGWQDVYIQTIQMAKEAP